MDHPHPTRPGLDERPIDVLVVEDDADMRVMMETLLRTSDCVVRAVASVSAAHEAVLARLPDVVVSDLNLGDTPGWTFAAALRSDARTRYVGLIAVTGQVAPRREVVAPFDAYVTKPIDVALLLALVEQVASMSRAQAGRVAPAAAR